MTEPARSVYIASPEGHTGKSVVALGLLELLTGRVRRVGVFRPIARSADIEGDQLLQLLLSRDGVDTRPEHSVGVTYDDVHQDPDGALATIVDRYHVVADGCEIVVVVGSDYTDVAGPTELAYNARVATNLGSPVMLVISAHEREPNAVADLADVALSELRQAHATAIGVVANRCDPSTAADVGGALGHLGLPVWTLPEAPVLGAPLVSDLVVALGGEVVGGDEALLRREAEEMLVCGMNAEHVLERLDDGQLCIVAGDRPDVIITLASANAADGFPSLAGLVLNGGYQPGEEVLRLVHHLDEHLPVVLTPHSSYEAARIVASTRGLLGRGSQRKIDTALAVFEAHVDADSMLDALEVPPSPVVTPLMFESMLLERARSDRRHIVLPEGDDDRVLRAASTLLSRQVVDVTILGGEPAVRSRAAALGVDVDAAPVIDPRTSELAERFAEEYARLRAHKGITLDRGRRAPGRMSSGCAPLQYDAAVDAAVAEAKMPGSSVAGRATVFVFPDLNTGNNTYKAVQRSAGAVAMGPVLQGLAKPVNDLSRGATVRDIVNTVAITAVQAQAMRRGRGS